MLERLLDALAALPLAPTYLVLMVLSAVENIFPPVPADTAVALGAFLALAGHELARNWDTVKALVADTNRALGIAALVLSVAAAAWLWRRSRRHPA